MNGCEQYIGNGNLSRRQFMQLALLTAGGLMVGCATDPVTGRSQLMLVSEESELNIDRQNSPHQFSSDYGKLQDRRLNDDQTQRYQNQKGQQPFAQFGSTEACQDNEGQNQARHVLDDLVDGHNGQGLHRADALLLQKVEPTHELPDFARDVTA